MGSWSIPRDKFQIFEVRDDVDVDLDFVEFEDVWQSDVGPAG
jgi:hypothetical protein